MSIQRVFKALSGAVIAALFLCPSAKAAAGGQITTDTFLPIPSTLAFSSTFSVRTDGMNWASAQVIATSATVPSVTFQDGALSSTTLTVVSFVALSTAFATSNITISSNGAPGLTGACVSGGAVGLGSFNACNPANWAIGASSGATACNLAAAINSFSVIVASCNVQTPGVVFTTAPYAGSIWNTFTLNSSTPAAISTAVYSGGQDNQSLTITGNGVTKVFLANRDFFPATSVTATATSLASAINASSTTTNIAAASNGAVVAATATVVGPGSAYTIISSSNAAIPVPGATISGSVGTGTLLGGSTSAYTINTATITVAGEAFGTGQAVLFSTGSGVALKPLVNGTTYYAIALPGAQFAVANASTGSLVGMTQAIVLTSSQSLTTTDNFTFTAAPISGTQTMKWMVSNDNVNWVPYTTTPLNVSLPSTAITLPTYYSTGTLSTVDFGHLDYGWLGLQVNVSSQGAVNVQAHVIGKQN